MLISFFLQSTGGQAYEQRHFSLRVRECLVVHSCLILCDLMDCSPRGSSAHGDAPGKNTGVGCHALLQGVFPTQGLNPGLLHCRWILYHLSQPGRVREKGQDSLRQDIMCDYNDKSDRKQVKENSFTMESELTSPCNREDSSMVWGWGGEWYVRI